MHQPYEKSCWMGSSKIKTQENKSAQSLLQGTHWNLPVVFPTLSPPQKHHRGLEKGFPKWTFQKPALILLSHALWCKTCLHQSRTDSLPSNFHTVFRKKKTSRSGATHHWEIIKILLCFPSACWLLIYKVSFNVFMSVQPLRNLRNG